MLAIDYRPITGRFYGVSSLSQVYTIDADTGMTTPVRTPFTPQISGEIGLDFDPLSDRLRLASSDQQLRAIAPLSGQVIASVPLAYRSGDRNFNVAPQIAALAHDENYLGATRSTLYAIDAGLDVLVRIDAAGFIDTIGALMIDAGPTATFDIAGGAAFAVIGAALVRIDLASGVASAAGSLPAETRGLALALPGSVGFSTQLYAFDEDSVTVRILVQRSGGASGAVSVSYATNDGSARAGSDYTQESGMLSFADGATEAEIEIELSADAELEANETFTITLSAPMGGLAIGGIGAAELTIVNDEHLSFLAVTEDGRLIGFDDSDPQTFTTNATITGLEANETLLGIDVGPDDRLYALGLTRRLYSIDPSNARATVISAVQYTPAPRNNVVGFDIDPIAARAHITAVGSRVHLSLDLATATAAVELPQLDYAMGDINDNALPAISAIAWSGSTFLGIDQAQDVLVRIDPAPMGVHTIGPLQQNAGSLGGFDILEGSAIGHAVLVVGFGNPALYAVDLQSGAVSVIGVITAGVPVRGLAIAPSGRFNFAATVYPVREGETAAVTLERIGGDNGPASIEVELDGGTATPGVDLPFMRGVVNFAHRQTRATLEIPITADADTEGVETAILRINNRAGTRSSATLNISDGAPPPPDAGTTDNGAGDRGDEDGAIADSSTIAADASANADAGTSSADAGTPGEDEGCGCKSTRGSRASLALLFVLVPLIALRKKFRP